MLTWHSQSVAVLAYTTPPMMPSPKAATTRTSQVPRPPAACPNAPMPQCPNAPMLKSHDSLATHAHHHARPRSTFRSSNAIPIQVLDKFPLSATPFTSHSVYEPHTMSDKPMLVAHLLGYLSANLLRGLCRTLDPRNVDSGTSP
jgi:hypothetical protein